MEDRDFKSMMSEHEAGKARGPPSGSHFAKMQNASIWGVKPNFMGEGKDWVMPEKVPEAKENNEHVEKADTIQEAKPAETTSTAATASVSPMEGVGNLTSKRASAFGTELRPFRDVMIEKKARLGYDPYKDQFELYLQMYPEKRKKIEEDGKFIGGPNGHSIAMDNAFHQWMKENEGALSDAEEEDRANRQSSAIGVGSGKPRGTYPESDRYGNSMAFGGGRVTPNGTYLS